MTSRVATPPALIIMIEDDPGHARLIARNLQRAGVTAEIRHFHSGSEALTYLLGRANSGQLDSKRPILILLDLNLGDMAGIDLLARVKNDANLRRTPVIVLTTTDDEIEMRRCYDLGANLYVTKPVAYEGFANTIRQLGQCLPLLGIPLPA